MAQPVAFACSPRAAGNSDTALERFCRGVALAGGSCRVVRLRERPLRPCVGCGACAKQAGCALPDAAQAEELFALLRTAPFVFFAAPIYFYHLPAGFKAFIDRSQAQYERFEQAAQTEAAGTAGGAGAEPGVRPAYAALVAGRPTGERLFAGSLLTLRYFLHPFGLRLEEPLLFPGKDQRGDLAADRDALQRLEAYGRAAWDALSP